MPTSRKTALKSQQYEKKIGKVSSNSGSKKEKSPFAVGPVVLALFLFVVVGSAIVQIISSAQKGLVYRSGGRPRAAVRGGATALGVRGRM
eukprot:CAMPEP_0204600772 /NCGR_PEP_ID=MMETSP0661-20131031/55638_1 /ASSEMBLY_ACC=CAM_ASM_000606 /TAXON_ID=109239 /ORGANISM="Alexandrium margalefi, Strain AMGDE01CS-322" /LENGTH=89 /DNA_ID=CAMNT_0051611601 /DNA_START=90 /DNA_END=357 /DNA_ORIENTATION=-